MTVSAPLGAIDLEPILGTLDAEQRAAATLPDGPAQIIAPAGSGKTTTMVARLAVLLSRGVAAERICVVTFNRDAALDLGARIERRLAGSVPAARSIEVRTLHALARAARAGRVPCWAGAPPPRPGARAGRGRPAAGPRARACGPGRPRPARPSPRRPPRPGRPARSRAVPRPSKRGPHSRRMPIF